MTGNQNVTDAVWFITDVGVDLTAGYKVAVKQLGEGAAERGGKKTAEITVEKVMKAGDNAIAAPRGIGGVSVDDMLRAGQQADRNGLTKAGRALQKHGDRVGSVFPRSAGNPAARNTQGQIVLEGILNSGTQKTRRNRLGGMDIFDSATGRGVRYDGNGNFITFLEP